MAFPRIGTFKSVDQLRSYADSLDIVIPFDDHILTSTAGSPLAQPIKHPMLPKSLGNRWCIHPMEGWDAHRDGTPSELTERRWQRFGLSGAKLIWGGEAVAVVPEGRANPNQLVADSSYLPAFANLLNKLKQAHQSTGEQSDDLLVGLQLTHSGRFARPNGPKLEPMIAAHHPILDQKFGIDPNDQAVLASDDYLKRLVDHYVSAARLSADAGFDFVDIKACHSYLMHELLGARTRPGEFGGSLENRSRLLRTVIERIRSEVPSLAIGVRLSVFDMVAYVRGEHGKGQAWPNHEVDPTATQNGFCLNKPGCHPNELILDEAFALLDLLSQAGVSMINISAGSPYYNPHLLRPAAFPPTDGYLPPEDPLIGVARQLAALQRCKQHAPNLLFVASALSYLQDYLPHAAQALVRDGWTDLVGLGRMVLAYPELPRDCLQRGAMDRKRICRTFSDCTTGPRNGMISGCFPLDEFYQQRPEAKKIYELRVAASKSE